MANNSKKHIYLIDGSGYIFRAYYALPPLTRKSDGLPVGAVSGFCNMLYKFLEESRSLDKVDRPTHFAVIFDTARKNFRNDPDGFVQFVKEELAENNIKYDMTFWENYVDEIMQLTTADVPMFRTGGLV